MRPRLKILTPRKMTLNEAIDRLGDSIAPYAPGMPPSHYVDVPAEAKIDGRAVKGYYMLPAAVADGERLGIGPGMITVKTERRGLGSAFMRHMAGIFGAGAALSGKPVVHRVLPADEEWEEYIGSQKVTASYKPSEFFKKHGYVKDTEHQGMMVRVYGPDEASKRMSKRELEAVRLLFGHLPKRVKK